MGRQQRYEESMKLCQTAVQRAAASLGEEHPMSMYCSVELARALRERHPDESEQLLRKAVRLRRKVMGEYSVFTIRSMFELGRTLILGERYQEAVIWLERSYRRASELLGPEHEEEALESCAGLGLSCYGSCSVRVRYGMAAA